MTVDVNSYLFRKRRGREYTCLHFAEEVWLAATGNHLKGQLASLYDSKLVDRRNELRGTGLKRLRQLINPCLVLMTQLGRSPHIGVYLDGKVLHLHQNGAEYFPIELAGRGFTSFRYYA